MQWGAAMKHLGQRLFRQHEKAGLWTQLMGWGGPLGGWHTIDKGTYPSSKPLPECGGPPGLQRLRKNTL